MLFISVGTDRIVSAMFILKNKSPLIMEEKIWKVLVSYSKNVRQKRLAFMKIYLCHRSRCIEPRLLIHASGDNSLWRKSFWLSLSFYRLQTKFGAR